MPEQIAKKQTKLSRKSSKDLKTIKDKSVAAQKKDSGAKRKINFDQIEEVDIARKEITGKVRNTCSRVEQTSNENSNRNAIFAREFKSKLDSGIHE